MTLTNKTSHRGWEVAWEREKVVLNFHIEFNISVLAICKLCVNSLCLHFLYWGRALRGALACIPSKRATLSLFCLQAGPYHLALTSRNGSLHQQLSAPFSLLNYLLKKFWLTAIATLLLPSSSLHAFYNVFAFMTHLFFLSLDSLFGTTYLSFHLSSSISLAQTGRKLR